MSDIKREFLHMYAFYDRAGITAHLEKRAAEGWLLEKMGGYCWPDRIAEISFPWEWNITPEIIAIAAGVLKSA